MALDASSRKRRRRLKVRSDLTMETYSPIPSDREVMVRRQADMDSMFKKVRKAIPIVDKRTGETVATLGEPSPRKLAKKTQDNIKKEVDLREEQDREFYLKELLKEYRLYEIANYESWLKREGRLASDDDKQNQKRVMEHRIKQDEKRWANKSKKEIKEALNSWEES